jgi:hypothetical protein
VLLAPACASDVAAPSPVPTRVLVDDAAFPVAVWAETDGSLLYGERLTGDVRRVAADGTLDRDVVAHVDVVVAPDDQRGLLGLVRDRAGRLIAAWTRPSDRRLVVGQVDVEPARLIWEGPPSADLANGGHLDVLPTGRIVIGVGDLLAPGELADDPAVPNRKVLSLDPDGAPSQSPTILSSGWNNPFAIVVDAAGVVWVADNTGGAGPERIGRGDEPAARATAMGGPGEGEMVPAALVALGPDRLGLCTFLGADLREVRIIDGRAEVADSAIAAPCGTGAARLADGRIAMATPDRIVVTERAVT